MQANRTRLPRLGSHAAAVAILAIPSAVPRYGLDIDSFLSFSPHYAAYLRLFLPLSRISVIASDFISRPRETAVSRD